MSSSDARRGFTETSLPPQSRIRVSASSADRIQTGHRFIHKDYLRIIDESLRDSDSLKHTLRVFSELAVGAVRIESYQRQQFFASHSCLLRWNAKQRCRVLQQLAAGKVVVEVWVLGQITDPGSG